MKVQFLEGRQATLLDVFQLAQKNLEGRSLVFFFSDEYMNFYKSGFNGLTQQKKCKFFTRIKMDELVDLQHSIINLQPYVHISLEPAQLQTFIFFLQYKNSMVLQIELAEINSKVRSQDLPQHPPNDLRTVGVNPGTSRGPAAQSGRQLQHLQKCSLISSRPSSTSRVSRNPSTTTTLNISRSNSRQTKTTKTSSNSSFPTKTSPYS